MICAVCLKPCEINCNPIDGAPITDTKQHKPRSRWYDPTYNEDFCSALCSMLWHNEFYYDERSSDAA